MQRIAALTFALLLMAPISAQGATCDKDSLAKLEADIGAMSGKEQKKAKRQLANAKAAFAAGDAKKCQRIVSKIATASSKGTSTARSSIEAVNAQFMKEYSSKDAAALASHYAEDAAAFPPDQMRVDDRENIQKMWQAVIDAGVTDFALTTTEVEESEDLAMESGTFSLKAPGKDGNPMNVTGKYVVVWKMSDDGTWQLYRDIWNGDAAMKSP
jgi:ketosteroid isomerase-like protein